MWVACVKFIWTVDLNSSITFLDREAITTFWLWIVLCQRSQPDRTAEEQAVLAVHTTQDCSTVPTCPETRTKTNGRTRSSIWRKCPRPTRVTMYKVTFWTRPTICWPSRSTRKVYRKALFQRPITFKFHILIFWNVHLYNIGSNFSQSRMFFCEYYFRRCVRIYLKKKMKFNCNFTLNYSTKSTRA